MTTKNQTAIGPESEPETPEGAAASSDEKRTAELANDIDKKLWQASGVLKLIGESELIRERHRDDPYRGIEDAVGVARDLVDAAEKAFGELQQIEPWAP